MAMATKSQVQPEEELQDRKEKFKPITLKSPAYLLESTPYRGKALIDDYMEPERIAGKTHTVAKVYFNGLEDIIKYRKKWTGKLVDENNKPLTGFSKAQLKTLKYWHKIDLKDIAKARKAAKKTTKKPNPKDVAQDKLFSYLGITPETHRPIETYCEAELDKETLEYISQSNDPARAWIYVQENMSKPVGGRVIPKKRADLLNPWTTIRYDAKAFYKQIKELTENSPNLTKSLTDIQFLLLAADQEKEIDKYTARAEQELDELEDLLYEASGKKEKRVVSEAIAQKNKEIDFLKRFIDYATRVKDIREETQELKRLRDGIKKDISFLTLRKYKKQWKKEIKILNEAIDAKCMSDKSELQQTLDQQKKYIPLSISDNDRALIAELGDILPVPDVVNKIPGLADAWKAYLNKQVRSLDRGELFSTIKDISRYGIDGKIKEAEEELGDLESFEILPKGFHKQTDWKNLQNLKKEEEQLEDALSLYRNIFILNNLNSEKAREFLLLYDGLRAKLAGCEDEFMSLLERTPYYGHDTHKYFGDETLVKRVSDPKNVKQSPHYAGEQEVTQYVNDAIEKHKYALALADPEISKELAPKENCEKEFEKFRAKLPHPDIVAWRFKPSVYALGRRQSIIDGKDFQFYVANAGTHNGLTDAKIMSANIRDFDNVMYALTQINGNQDYAFPEQ